MNCPSATWSCWVPEQLGRAGYVRPPWATCALSQTLSARKRAMTAPKLGALRTKLCLGSAVGESGASDKRCARVPPSACRRPLPNVCLPRKAKPPRYKRQHTEQTAT